jgi:hypothetical protein
MPEVRRLAVIYTEDAEGGSGQVLVGLDELRAAMRPERHAELLEDLTMACRDALAARGGVAPLAGPIGRIK